jgi:undecaprenyl diphosphate synthase
MGLLRHYLEGEIAALDESRIRLRVIGERNRFAADIRGLIEKAEALTRDNSGINLTVALSYGGRAEIVSAVRAIAAAVAEGSLSPTSIGEETVARRLYTAGIPDPDLLVRTSGEQRISNFLLWQCAYAEFVFTKTLWPDFSKADLLGAIEEYSRRERRYGGFAGERS